MTNLLKGHLCLLHFAPEPCIAGKLSAIRSIRYVSADIAAPLAAVRTDIGELPFPDGVFDVILCSHVLEHIRDDQAAMKELFRVMRPGGWGILQVPLDSRRDRTFEDSSVASGEDRRRLFGQSDHLRVYGRDYRRRLENAGFCVRVEAYAARLGSETVKRYALMPDEEIYFCMKS